MTICYFLLPEGVVIRFGGSIFHSDKGEALWETEDMRTRHRATAYARFCVCPASLTLKRDIAASALDTEFMRQLFRIVVRRIGDRGLPYFKIKDKRIDQPEREKKNLLRRATREAAAAGSCEAVASPRHLTRKQRREGERLEAAAAAQELIAGWVE